MLKLLNVQIKGMNINKSRRINKSYTLRENIDPILKILILLGFLKGSWKITNI